MNARPVPPNVPPPRFKRGPVIALSVLGGVLVLGGWALWHALAGDAEPGPTPAQLRVQQQRIEVLEQQVATLSRSDQISRDANRDLQATLSERDEEIAGLRADVAFYERFVGATAQRRGLSVHELILQPQDEQAWHFTATLTQNLNRGAVNAGRLLVSVEGTEAGKLRRLAWADLRQQPNAPGVPYSFKYFQQVEGDLLLPPGFKPVRVIARVVPQSGAAVEQSFPWAQASAKKVPAKAPARAELELPSASPHPCRMTTVVSLPTAAAAPDYQSIDRPLNFTPAAAAKVRELIQEEGSDSLALRVYIQGGGCSGFQYGFEFDENRAEDDVAVDTDGVSLLVDPLSLQYLMGAEVDYSESLQGAQFVIRNPNAKTTCGCGSSFSM